MSQPIRGPQKRRFLIMQVLLWGMVLWWCGGCASSGDGVPRTMEADYGRSVTCNRLEMMVTPPEAVDSKPPVGLEPQAAQNVQKRYDDGFKKPTRPRPVISIIPGSR
ncbi:MAG: hypothetical protein AB1424_13985 [Thermodesulfobacteriota bacterium]